MLQTKILNKKKIPSWVSECINLKIFICNGYYIKEIENLPPGLEILSLNKNAIKKLTNLLPGLKKLYCDFNDFTELENLPPNL